MTRYGKPIHLIFGAAIVFAGMVPTTLSWAQAGPVTLASHRAIYDLKLSQVRGRRTLAGVEGRIVYDFSGSACEGYSLQFRQVTQLDNGEGKVVVSDLRSATWEDGKSLSFRFNYQNFLNQIQVDGVDGNAEHRPDAVAVSLTKPDDKKFTLDPAIVFPTEHMRRVIEAARAGTRLLELPVYDGSENGEKLYSTLTVIGPAIAPDQRKPDDAAAGKVELAGLVRWPVTISYFDKSKKDGDQLPVYAITFELYENGISRALSLDYGDFVITGEMTSLDIRTSQPCK